MKKMVYPKNLDTTTESDGYGYGGVRIYPITKGLADEIVKEFPKHFKFKPAFHPDVTNRQLFYMNVNHGEQHFIFSLSNSPNLPTS
jgi:hypothetical protein